MHICAAASTIVYYMALRVSSSYSAIATCLRTASGVSLPENVLILLCMMSADVCMHDSAAVTGSLLENARRSCV